MLPLAKVEVTEEIEVRTMLAGKLRNLFPAQECEKLATCIMRQLVG